MLFSGPNAVSGAGLVHLHLGAATGPAALPAATLLGDTGEYLGDALGATDIDGDGASDAITGAPQWSWYGRARLYSGAGAAGTDDAPVPLAARPTQPDTTRIGYAGRSENEDNLYVDANVGLPVGRTDAFLEVELEEVGTPFDGAALHSGATTDTGLGGAATFAWVSGLTSDTAYHWRARAAGDPVRSRYVSHGPWHYGGRLGDTGGLHVRTACALDLDGDGVCDAFVPVDDLDGDGWTVDEGECADTDASVYPGAPESCDDTDSDCDGDLVDGFANFDGDGEPDCVDDDDDDDGDPDVTDCDDFDASVYAGATEACDDVDSDCDGSLVDEFDDFDNDEDPDCTDPDDDNDGDPDLTDCADLDDTIYDGAPESCDAIDSDCDGDLVDHYVDTDGDGDPDCIDDDDDDDGDPDSTDCDDGDDTVYNGAPESCDNVDSDCDGDLVDGFADTDGDGIPDCVDLDNDGDGYDASVDCDDDDPAIHPTAVEACDETDSDCDGSIVDEFDDTDGNLVPNCVDPDDDGDGDGDGTDCAPLNPAIYNGAVEACDATDSDCDGSLVDELDDTDGAGDPDCADPDDDGDGDLDVTDCDDGDATVYTGAPELCDEADSDCDGSLVDHFADTDSDMIPDCTDEDDDGDGVLDGDDCDPLDGSVYPGASESCDGVDSDCDGDLADDFDDSDGDGVPDCVDFDNDGDGFDASVDCDDDDDTVFPGATEACDDLDQDCDGSIVDEDTDTDGDLVPDCVDLDDDGDGDGDAVDCAPLDPAIYNGAIEACDATDSDCDGDLVDGYANFDGDALPDCADEDDDDDGDPDATDCEPFDDDVYAGATEFCDLTDSDCDGDLVDEFDDTDGDGDPDCTDEDDDGDGFFDGDDCGPMDATVFPGAEEVCDDVDQDCDGDLLEDFPDLDADGIADCMDEDGDGDGFTEEGGDCDDANPDVHPDADEVCNEGVDDDCDPATTEDDADADGVQACAGDCDDGDPAVYPDAPELCDGMDNDCDGLLEQPGEVDFVNWYADADGDGWGDAAVPHPENPLCEPPEGYASNDGDCADGDAAVSPAADEVCGDGIDNDCDGEDRACADDEWPTDDHLPLGCVCDAAGGAGPTPWLALLPLLALRRARSRARARARVRSRARSRSRSRSRPRVLVLVLVLGFVASPALADEAPIVALSVDPDRATRAVKRIAGRGADVDVRRLDASLFVTERLVLGAELESFCSVPSLTPPELQNQVEFATQLIDDLEMATGRMTLERARSRLVCLTEEADGEALWKVHFAEAVAAYYATDTTTSAIPALRRALSVRPGAGYDPAYPPQLEQVYLDIQADVLQAGSATAVGAGEVWIDGVALGPAPAPVVPGEHLLQVRSPDGKVRGGFVTVAAGDVLAVGDPAGLGEALLALDPASRGVLAEWLRPRAAVSPAARIWIVDAAGTVAPLEEAEGGGRVRAPSPGAPLVLAVGGGYAAADRASYGAVSLDVSVGLVGILRFDAWARVTISGGVPSPVDGEVRRAVLVPFGFGPSLRFDGPVDPFVGLSLQLGIDQEGTEAKRLHPGTAPNPEAIPMAGLLLTGGVAIPLGPTPLDLRVVGEVGFLGEVHPVARALVQLGVRVGG